MEGMVKGTNKQSQVEQTFMYLTEQMETLNKALIELQERLTPVLMDEVPVPNEVQDERIDEPLVAVAFAIHGACSRCAGFTDKVYTLISRLGI